MNTPIREALMLWDFDHAKNRQKVYVASIWQVECRCGLTFQTMQAWEDHRFDEGVELFSEQQERIQQVEAEREHFAQVARDTFAELRAITAERDAALSGGVA